jgi:hypothetical protein
MNASLVKAKAHLAVVLGSEKAQTILDDCVRESGLDEIESPDALLELGRVMLSRGGFVEIVGRFVRVQAIVGGAHFEATV